MRILVATDQWFPDVLGGVARVASETAAGWAREGHAVTVIAPEGPQPAAWTPTARLELVRALPRGRGPKTLRDPFATRRAANRLAPRTFDVCVAHTSTTAAGLASSRVDAPLVYVFHADAAAEARFTRAAARSGRERSSAAALEPLLRLLGRRAIRSAARIAVLSEYSRGLLAELSPGAAAAAALVGGGVDTDAFTPDGRDEERARLGLDETTRLVLTVRRLVPRMGIDLLLDATATLGDVAGLTLAIAGAGPLEADLRRRCGELGLDDTVRFLGRVPDDELRTWYRAADLFVVPTVEHEGFGLVTAEALASGTPVVGTRVGATPELLAPLEPALLADDASVGALAAALRRGLELATPAFRERCRRHAVERLSWAAVLPAWTALLAGAAGDAGR